MMMVILGQGGAAPIPFLRLDLLDDEEIRELSRANAAMIHEEEVVDLGKTWSEMTDRDKIIAVIACPKGPGGRN